MNTLSIRNHLGIAIGLLGLFAAVARADEPAAAPTTGPQESGVKSMFIDEKDGYLDVSNFLATKHGFLPIVIPITEPAVGYGGVLGLTFFHDSIQIEPGKDGKPPRAVLPSITAVAGGGTENGTWFGGVFHMGNWFENQVHYTGGIGYGSANLDWYGQSDQFDGQSFAYNNDVLFMIQRVMFDIGESDFYIGPQYKFMGTHASFDTDGSDIDIPTDQLESQVSGLGLTVGFDNRDHPFAPTRGVKAELTYLQQGPALGSDYDYGRISGYALAYFPIADTVTLGLRTEAAGTSGDAPFYDLAMISMRGIPYGRYVDDSKLTFEAELRWDVAERWTVVGFGGVGVVSDDFGDLFDEDEHYAAGVGFRYLIARKFGLRMGLDFAYGDDEVAMYVTVGTGWVRP